METFNILPTKSAAIDEVRELVREEILAFQTQTRSRPSRVAVTCGVVAYERTSLMNTFKSVGTPPNLSDKVCGTATLKGKFEELSIEVYVTQSWAVDSHQVGIDVVAPRPKLD